MNKWKTFSLIILLTFIIGSTSLAQVKIPEVAVKDLKDSPKTHLGLTVTTVGTLQVAPGRTMYEGEYILVDQEGNSFPVNAWVPIEIPPPQPGINFQRDFPLIEDYLDKVLKVEGNIRLDEGRSEINKKEHYFLHVSTATEVK